MPTPLETARQKAESTYTSAADCFDAAPLGFWARTGQRAVERLALRPGAQVLDVCCGSGASAIPAAHAVGPDGLVVAVDLTDPLLALARAKARAAGLWQVDFRRGDMTALGFPDAHFDAVVCVFGIFFVPDMERQVAELWRMVRPGGQLAITTWGPDIWAPGYSIFHEAVRRLRPDLVTAFNPWDRISAPAAVRKLFADAGVPGAQAVLEESYQPLAAPEDFWTIALGSGLRWIIDQLGPEAATAVRAEVIGTLAARRVNRVATHAIHASARKT
ncbi:MAG TPA: methyltransferase domain-containing protein [Planctomycetota bacterium]|nr:methyltransferase domain-containing protein [Planctomycetota bacterium]